MSFDFDAEAFRRELDAQPMRVPWQTLRYDGADLPPEPDTERLADWQDRLVDDEDIDRTLTDEMPPGVCPRVWSQTL